MIHDGSGEHELERHARTMTPASATMAARRSCRRDDDRGSPARHARGLTATTRSGRPWALSNTPRSTQRGRETPRRHRRRHAAPGAAAAARAQLAAGHRHRGGAAGSAREAAQLHVLPRRHDGRGPRAGDPPAGHPGESFGLPLEEALLAVSSRPNRRACRASCSACAPRSWRDTPWPMASADFPGPSRRSIGPPSQPASSPAISMRCSSGSPTTPRAATAAQSRARRDALPDRAVRDVRSASSAGCWSTWCRRW
jgi:hypothetical protein